MKRNKFLKSIVALPFAATLLSVVNKPKISERTVFTPEMLKRHNYGLFIINTKVKEITLKNIGYAATVAWKLTWSLKYWKNSDGTMGQFPTHSKTNVFTDGWICPIGNSYEDVCEYLNNNSYGESFRLMTKEEVLFIISNRKQGFL